LASNGFCIYFYLILVGNSDDCYTFSVFFIYLIYYYFVFGFVVEIIGFYYFAKVFCCAELVYDKKFCLKIGALLSVLLNIDWFIAPEPIKVPNEAGGFLFCKLLKVDGLFPFNSFDVDISILFTCSSYFLLLLKSIYYFFMIRS
jgi:hypothetical protein